MALVQAFDATQNKTFLDRATAIFVGSIMPAWDTSACGGGVWWDASHTQKVSYWNSFYLEVEKSTESIFFGWQPTAESVSDNVFS